MIVVPITEAKGRLSELVHTADNEDVILVRHGRPAAVLVAPARLEALAEEIEDLKDRLSIYITRDEDPDQRLSVEKIEAELGLAGGAE